MLPKPPHLAKCFYKLGYYTETVSVTSDITFYLDFPFFIVLFLLLSIFHFFISFLFHCVVYCLHISFFLFLSLLSIFLLSNNLTKARDNKRFLRKMQGNV